MQINTVLPSILREFAWIATDFTFWTTSENANSEILNV
jgi:hypothetical protein